MTNKFLLSKSLHPDNGSGMDRKCTGNGSALLRSVLTLFLFLFPFGVGNAWGADGDVAYTLSMSNYYSGSKPSGYASTADLLFGTSTNNKTWNVPGNCTLGSYFAIGGKSLSNANRIIYGKSTITNIIKEVKVNYSGVSNGKSSTLTLNSAKLEVSNTSSFGTSDIIETVSKTSLSITSSSGSGSISFKPSSSNWASGKYYRLTFNCSTTGSNNSHFDVTSIEFIEGSSGGGSTPTIIVGSLSPSGDFGFNLSTGVAEKKSFTVSGSNLTANISVTPPAGYEISTSENGTYQTSAITLTQSSGSVASTTIWARLRSRANINAGSYSGNIACSSTGATTRNVAVSGSAPFKVTWIVNNNTEAPFATTYVAYASGDGTALGSLPSPAPDPKDYCGDEFYGWYAGNSYKHASTAPSIISTSTKINEDKSYIAVFADVEDGGSSTTWVKTEISAATAGTYALITPDGYAFNGTINSSGHGTVTANAFSFNNNNVATSAPSGTCEIEFQAVTGGFKLYNSSNGYLYASAASSGSLAWHNSENSYWKYASSNWLYNSNSAYLRSYQNATFRTYSQANGSSFSLAKKTTVSNKSYSNFVTTCCTPLAQINGSFLVSHF